MITMTKIMGNQLKQQQAGSTVTIKEETVPNSIDKMAPLDLINLTND